MPPGEGSLPCPLCPGRLGPCFIDGEWAQKGEGVAWICCSSVTQVCLTLCDPMTCSTPGFPVHRHLLELTQTHVHQVGDGHDGRGVVPFSSAFSLSQRRGLFQ